MYLNIAVFYGINPCSLIISVPTFQKNLPRGSSIYLPWSIMSVCVCVYIYIFMRLFCFTYLFPCYDRNLPVECKPMYARVHCRVSTVYDVCLSLCLSVCLSVCHRVDVTIRITTHLGAMSVRNWSALFRSLQ
jgi:hypothetical protein